MISPTELSPGKGKPSIYELKILLAGSKPPIWRRLQVPGSASLGWLHAVIQVAMGWTNSHLHHFLTPNARYTDLRYVEDVGFGEEPDRDETKVTLAQVAPQKGARLRYEYDFGDSWIHQIMVEKILAGPPVEVSTACCLAGVRACPPEDCGGIWGYAELLKTVKNRKHPDHEMMKQWLGPFDAEAFDVASTNRWLRKLKWPRVTQAQLRQVLMGRDGYSE